MRTHARARAHRHMLNSQTHVTRTHNGHIQLMHAQTTLTYAHVLATHMHKQKHTRRHTQTHTHTYTHAHTTHQILHVGEISPFPTAHGGRPARGDDSTAVCWSVG